MRGAVDRRRFLKATGAGAGVTVLAGCITTEETPEPDEDGGDGGGGDGGGGDGGSIEGTVTLGAMGPADSAIGESILNSVELAAQEINDDGGIGGADVDVVVKDTQDDPGVARSAYQELTTGEDVDATVGIFGSEQLLSIMPNMAQQETVHLGAGAATPEASQRVREEYERFKYFFRVGPVNSHYLGVNMVDFADANFGDLGWESVAVLAEDFKWTEPITEALAGDLEATGVDVPITRRVPEGTEDFTPVYDDIEAEGVDAVYTVLAHIGNTSLVQWASQRRPFEYGGIHVPAQLPTYHALTEGAATYSLVQTTATPTSAITDRTLPYVEAYNGEFDAYPVYTGYIAYDAVHVYREAVERAGTLDDDAVVSALEETSYTGTAGTLEFYGRDHEYPHDVKYGPEKAWPVWFQWQQADGGGAQRVVWPDDLAEADYQTPPWV